MAGRIRFYRLGPDEAVAGIHCSRAELDSAWGGEGEYRSLAFAGWDSNEHFVSSDEEEPLDERTTQLIAERAGWLMAALGRPLAAPAHQQEPPAHQP